MKVAIRDDDLCYFTSPEDIEKAYSFAPSACISFSVIPNAVPRHQDAIYPYGEGHPFHPYSIEKNEDILSYLRERLQNGSCEILLHGYTHEYRKIGSRWEPEMIWKSKEQIDREMGEGKRTLESLLSCRIRTFVAPSNKISQKGIDAVEKYGMNFCGVMHFADRRPDLYYLRNFAKRWGERITKGVQYAGVLDFGKHLELNAYKLETYDRLVFEYELCKKKNEPFVLYTHYWDVNRRPEVRKLLLQIYDHVMEDGATLVPLSACFPNKNNH